MTLINFDVTEAEEDLILAIVERGEKLLVDLNQMPRNRMTMIMDITACHANGNPLLLERMLEADDGNFAHDFFGIQGHIDRSTGKVTDCFLPRFTDMRAQRLLEGWPTEEVLEQWSWFFTCNVEYSMEA